MSLLLDALKRAEQEKLSKQGERVEPAPAAPSPAPAPPPPGALELQPIGEARAGIAAARTAGAGARSDAEAANTVFQAKQNNASGSRAGIIWAISIAIAVVVLGASGYIWYMMESLKPRVAPVARASRPLPIALPGPQANAPPIDAPGAAPSTTAPPVAAAPAMTDAPLKEATPPATPAPETRRKDVVASLLQEARSPAAARPDLKLERSPERPTIAPGVAEGYRLLLAGDLAGARRSYSNAFAADPTSVDAQLGLATIEARLGNRAEAATLYRGVIDLDPRNGTALAGLAALAEETRPDAMQDGLQAALARSPDNAALHLALGNSYAAQLHWAEAQAEYYEAHRLEPGDPDIAYNLAVSLDHIGQSRAAAGLYARALANARGKGAQFDAAAVARRLAELK